MRLFVVPFFIFASTAFAQEVSVKVPMGNAVACPECYDVIGIRTRTPCSEALLEGYKQSSIEESTISSGKIKSEPFQSGHFLRQQSKTSSDQLYVSCTSPLFGSVVRSVKRDISFSAEAAPDTEAVIADIDKKYGTPYYYGRPERLQVRQFLLDSDHRPIASQEAVFPRPSNNKPLEIKAFEKSGVSAALTFVFSECGDDQRRLCKITTFVDDFEATALDAKLSKDFKAELKAISQSSETTGRKNSAPVPKL